MSQSYHGGGWSGGVAARRRATRSGAEEKPEPGVVGADEPLPEWERELLEDTEKKADEPAPVPPKAGDDHGAVRTH